MAWKDDEGVSQNLKRSEILNFVQHNYGEYRWSFTTLDCNHIDSVSTLGAKIRNVRRNIDHNQNNATFNVKTIYLNKKIFVSIIKE